MSHPILRSRFFCSDVPICILSRSFIRFPSSRRYMAVHGCVGKGWYVPFLLLGLLSRSLLALNLSFSCVPLHALSLFEKRSSRTHSHSSATESKGCFFRRSALTLFSLSLPPPTPLKLTSYHGGLHCPHRHSHQPPGYSSR